MLANLVIAKKAAAAVDTKARKEKKTNENATNNSNSNNNAQAGHGGGLPKANRTDDAALAADDRTGPGGEWREAARGTGGRDESGSHR